MEIIRADRSVAPLLFSMLERKLLDGIKRENLYIMTAMNYGEDYSSNIDFSDDALRRRQIFIDYLPSHEDFIKFMEKNDYHPILQEAAQGMPLSKILDHETTKELMQPTTFGSWDLLNKRWKSIEADFGSPIGYTEAKEDVQLFGSYFFTDATIKELVDKLILLESLNTIDIQKEIIDKNGLQEGVTIYDKKGKVYPKEGREKALAIKTMNFIRSETIKNPNYLAQQGVKIIELFIDEKTLMISMIKQIQNDIERKSLDANGKKTKESAELIKKVFHSFALVLNTCVKTDPNGKYAGLIEEFKSVYTLMNSEDRQ